jgi:predicted aldo/keto reductase-like oxidoreductase
MQYRENKTGERLSILGFGCMRLPVKAGIIDYKRAKAMIDYAVSKGVNYFDTAYIYHAGQSEGFLGKALHGIREKVNIATKLPPFLVKEHADIPKIFETQKKRLQTSYIDYYLIHALKDLAGWERLCSLGAPDFISERKRNGEIRNIGFSFHGAPDEFIKLIDAYDWDFCQIQYNYMDEQVQAGRAGLCYAHQKGLSVIVMEPLLGGHLVGKLPPKARRLFKDANESYSFAEWGLRWIWDQREPTVVLSGMSDERQVAENIATAESAAAGGLSENELSVIKRVKAEISSGNRVPCTGCGYCMPCPAGVDIPNCFNNYNTIYTRSKRRAVSNYITFTSGGSSGTGSQASRCVGCKKCVKHCPQGIDIPTELKKVANELEGLPFKLAMLLKGFLFGKP